MSRNTLKMSAPMLRTVLLAAALTVSMTATAQTAEPEPVTTTDAMGELDMSMMGMIGRAAETAMELRQHMETMAAGTQGGSMEPAMDASEGEMMDLSGMLDGMMMSTGMLADMMHDQIEMTESMPHEMMLACLRGDMDEFDEIATATAMQEDKAMAAEMYCMALLDLRNMRESIGAMMAMMMREQMIDSMEMISDMEMAVPAEADPTGS